MRRLEIRLKISTTRYLLSYQLAGSGAEVIPASRAWRAQNRKVSSLITSILMPLIIGSIESKHLLVSEAPSRASRAVKNGSVLFSLVRPYLENIALVEERYSHCIASTSFYVCNSNGALLPEFMYFLMISGYVVNSLNQYMKGDNSPSISKDNIESWLYPIPPLDEQKVICTKLNTTFTLIENVGKSLS